MPRSVNNLIVVCDKFGLKYSGGSTATALYTKELQPYFGKVYILCKESDGFLKDKSDIVYYNQFQELPSLINSYSLDGDIGYSDFYIGKYFIETSTPFYFTYHDNWPEMAKFVSEASFASDRMSDYEMIFKSAIHVFSVSRHKISHISKFTDKVSLVRNGLSQSLTKTELLPYDHGDKYRVLMAGNFSYRKYTKAIELFELILESNHTDIQIDIFGNEEDNLISKAFDKYSFVKKCEFRPELSYLDYHLYLNTSLVENLSLSVVDAIANYTPVISFDVGGTAEIINRDNGAIIEKFNVPLMLETIMSFKNEEKTFYFNHDSLKSFDWSRSAKYMKSIMVS